MQRRPERQRHARVVPVELPTQGTGPLLIGFLLVEGRVAASVFLEALGSS